MTVAETIAWPDLSDITPDPDGATFIPAQGEALLKAQIEGANGCRPGSPR